MQTHNHTGHGGNLRAAAREFNRKPGSFIDFSSNVNPLGPPPGLTRHLQKKLNTVNRYPEPAAVTLRRALAARLHLPAERLFIGNGASDLIHLLLLYHRPARVLLPAPTFSEYARAARLAKADVVHLPWPWTAAGSPDALISRLREHDFLVLCNPNNPTGIAYPPETLAALLQETKRRNVTLLIDESFRFFTGSRSAVNLTASEQSNLWVVTSLTKIWALPGLRLGYLVGPAAAVRLLMENSDPWRVNSLAQAAGLYCLRHPEHEAAAVITVAAERRFLTRHLQKLPGLTVYPGEANFLLLRGDERFNSAALYRFLGKRGLLIREAANFTGLDQRYFRIAVRLRRENRRLVAAIHVYFNMIISK